MARQATKKKFAFPTAYTILFLLLIAATIWIIPVSSYNYDAYGSPIPGTYHQVLNNPQSSLSRALNGYSPF